MKKNNSLFHRGSSLNHSAKKSVSKTQPASRDLTNLKQINKDNLSL